MKKIFLLSLLLLAAFSAFPQNCKIKEKVNEEGNPYYYTKDTKFLAEGVTYALYFRFINNQPSDTTSLQFYLKYDHSFLKKVIVGLDNYLTFYLENGETVILKPVFGFDSNNYHFLYHITKAQIKTISKQNCIKLTFEYHDKDGLEVRDDWVLTVLSRFAFKPIASCFLQH